MAKARFAKGLRVGSTKTETYSTLATKKQGRIQVIKDRVYEVGNPQSKLQMEHRVIFATVTKAAEIMKELIGIARENQPNAEFAKQEFITENMAFLREVKNRKMGIAPNQHRIASFAPKGNQQLIPNSYIVSKGSLMLPTVNNGSLNNNKLWVPRTYNDKGSYGSATFAGIGALGQLPFGDYTPAQLWSIMFGLQPGDQLTFPQIYGDGPAQVMYDGDYDGAVIVDKTIYTSYCAPRLVLLGEMPTTTITISATTTAAQLWAALKSGIDTNRTWSQISDNFENNLSIDDTADDILSTQLSDTYDAVFGASNDDVMRALGVILSRKVNNKWCYSTCQLTCVWDKISVNDGKDYYGFELGNAVDTYRTTAQTDANGNFLQRGGEPDIVPSGNFQ